jgi:hypothetical protein
MRTRVVVLVALTLTLALSACAPEPPPDVEALSGLDSMEQAPPGYLRWRDRQIEVCDEFRTRAEAEMAGLQAPRDLVGFTIYLDRLVPLNAEYTADVTAMPLPHHRRADVRRFYALTTRAQSLAERAQAAAHFDDMATLQQTIVDLNALSDTGLPLLDELGVGRCVARVATA